MNGWQVALIVYLVLTAILSLLTHGMEVRINFWRTLLEGLLLWWLLYMGGFWG